MVSWAFTPASWLVAGPVRRFGDHADGAVGLDDTVHDLADIHIARVPQVFHQIAHVDVELAELLLVEHPILDQNAGENRR